MRRTLVHKQHSELQTLLGNAEKGSRASIGLESLISGKFDRFPFFLGGGALCFGGRTISFLVKFESSVFCTLANCR